MILVQPMFALLQLMYALLQIGICTATVLTSVVPSASVGLLLLLASDYMSVELLLHGASGFYGNVDRHTNMSYGSLKSPLLVC